MAPGGVDPWASNSQTLTRLSWLDVNGDDCTNCLLPLENTEGEVDQRVGLGLQGETVYAYCINDDRSGTVGTDGVFHNDWGGTFALAFRDEQCCQYTPTTDTLAPEVIWETP